MLLSRSFFLCPPCFIFFCSVTRFLLLVVIRSMRIWRLEYSGNPPIHPMLKFQPKMQPARLLKFKPVQVFLSWLKSFLALSPLICCALQKTTRVHCTASNETTTRSTASSDATSGLISASDAHVVCSFSLNSLDPFRLCVCVVGGPVHIITTGSSEGGTGVFAPETLHS